MQQSGPPIASEMGIYHAKNPNRMLRVMLVDDSQKEVSLLKEGLQAAGYDVVEVSTSTRRACSIASPRCGPT